MIPRNHGKVLEWETRDEKQTTNEGMQMTAGCSLWSQPRQTMCSSANTEAASRPLADVTRGVTGGRQRWSRAASPFAVGGGASAPINLFNLMDGRSRLRLDKVGLYKVGKAIGRGNFATVRIARHEIAKTKVALKIIDKSLLDEENMIKIERELQILKTVEHPHIVKLYEVLRSERFLYLSTEYCTGGELYEVLTERGRTPENEARRIFAQITGALQYLHQKGIVHRDLKVENILLDKNSNVKIIDFGFANLQKTGDLLRTWCGSPPYAAPELLLGKEYDGFKADIWSLGVILFILVTGGFPYPGVTADALKRAVLCEQIKIPYWVSVECSDLIRKMLVISPVKRFGIGQVIHHRWMTMTASHQLQPSSSGLSRSLSRRLNPTILLFMQTHGKWSEEQIFEAVFNRDYESLIHGTYELLCEKVGKDNLDVSPLEDHPRRGSRGSIISGKAVLDQDAPAPTISAHQLAQLNLSSPSDSESDESSSSEIGDESPGYTRRRRLPHRQLFGVNGNYSENRNEHRRHTLCASEQIFSPDIVAQLPIGSPLHQAAFNHAALAALAAQSRTNPLFGNHVSLIPGIGGATPAMDIAQMLPVPNNERRASAGENLLPPGLELQASSSQAQSVEEEGQGYLNKFGGKRNTVHGGAGVGPSPPSVRHSRNPYPKTTSTERRSSWASPSISSQQQVQLEKLYRQATGPSNELFNIQKLQLEFQQLGKLATSTTNTATHSPTAQSGVNFGCPRISITDEHNRSTNCSTTFDPVNMFERKVCLVEGIQHPAIKANEVVFGQRPATAIGMASTSGTSGTSSPDQGARNGESRVKSFVSSLPLNDLVDELKSTLNNMRISYQESNEVVYMDHEMRRLSLSAGVEIGVAIIPPDDKSHVEFAILHGESPTSELVCEELVNQLRKRDPRGTLE